MASRPNRITDGERHTLVAIMAECEPEQLDGFLVIAISHGTPCGHRHLRTIRGGHLTPTEELAAIKQAVDMLYD